MILNVNGDYLLKNPTQAAVLKTVGALKLNTFATLCRAEEDYIQTYYNEDGTYELEFRDGSYDKHFQATSKTLTTDNILAAFVAFIADMPDWNSQWKWEIVEFDEDFEGDLTYDNAYLLNGEEYEKIPVGNEQTKIQLVDQKCSACRVGIGHYHEWECEFEECPCCHEPIYDCECE